MTDDEIIEHLELEVKVLRDNNKGLKDKIDEQSKEIEEYKDKFSDEKIRNTVLKRYREVIEKDYVSKDKIKAKIEEIDNIFKNNHLIDKLKNYFEAQKEVLQSLLEKE